MPPKYVVLNKNIGQTPLQALEAWKETHPDYKNVPATYAGRLDPMAEGKLLVLLGNECKQQEKYRGFDKEYEIEVLLDLSTDTGDILGIPGYVEKSTGSEISRIKEVLKGEIGSHTIPYPAFSSKTVGGKPLFMYALEGTLDTIAIPTHTETFYRIQLQSVEQIPKDKLQERISRILSVVPRSDEPSKALGADFRQDTIRAAWGSLLSPLPNRTFTILTLRVTSGSGAYMRTLAERIGVALGTQACALSIRRTKIGKYIKALGIWWKKF